MHLLRAVDERVPGEDGLEEVDGHVGDPERPEDPVEDGRVHLHQDPGQQVGVVKVYHLVSSPRFARTLLVSRIHFNLPPPSFVRVLLFKSPSLQFGSSSRTSVARPQLPPD